jgi:hypothetical protein
MAHQNKKIHPFKVPTKHGSIIFGVVTQTE